MSCSGKVPRRRSFLRAARPLWTLNSLLPYPLVHTDASHQGVALVSSFLTSRRHGAHNDIASKFMIDTGAGVVDADYRGVLFVLLFNHADVDFTGE
jgi:dUTP pyrophosphatase